MKPMTIWGRRFNGFVDTGSDASLISESQVPREAIRKTVTKKLEGFGGAVTNINQSVEGVATWEGASIPVILLIVPSEMMPYELLIGRDILCNADHQPLASSDVSRVWNTREMGVNINCELNESERRSIWDLLTQYENQFAEDTSRLGRCKTTEMTIEVTTDQPIVGKRYTVPLAKRPVLSAIVEKLEQHGIIRPSTSTHAAPVILVKKSNGEDRMCVDYRVLNTFTVKKHFPMPIVEEQLAKLAGNNFFTTLDMTAGYYQVPLSEGSKKYTAFITPDGLYEHNVMPFGLVNAPMVFQEMVTDIIKRLKYRSKIINYVDEVIIATTTVNEGLTVLKEFLEAVREAGLTLRPTKCEFLVTKVTFLGHVVSQSGIQPGDEKTRCITNFPRPQNASETRQFLGLTGYFRKFIANYGTVARPLTSLLRKSTPFVWSGAQDEAYAELKRALTERPLLAVYDPQQNHEVYTDASFVGLSGVLMQQEIDNWKPVHYFSRQCSAAESSYPSHELEVLAIVETIERLRVYLLGMPFVVVTDCNAIATTKANTLLKSRIARWWLRLQEFDFTCKHRAGSSMQHVDTLSRAPVEADEQTITVAEQVMKVQQVQEAEDWVYSMQMQDGKLKAICDTLKGTTCQDEAIKTQVSHDYEMHNNRLFRKIGDQLRLVVPRAVRWRITRSCHDDFGHIGLEKTIKRIERNFWFPRIRRYVKSYIGSCDVCCVNKVKGGKSESQLHLREVMPIPFRHLYIDHMGPFIRSSRGNSYLLVIVCGFSKYVILKPTRTTKTEPVIKALKETMTVFGQPMRVTTDRGTAYTSKQFQKFMEENGIQHEKTAVRTPRANGQVERFNKTVLSTLKCLVKNDKEWDTHLNNIQWTLNSQRHDVTKCAPNELILNYSPRDVTHNRLIQALHDEESNLSNTMTPPEVAAENIRQHRLKWKERYDQAHQQPRRYSEGDLVLVSNVPAATGQSRKLEPAFKGPYVITKRLNYDRYIVEDLPDAEKVGRRYSSIHSVDHLKPWSALCPELDDDSDNDSSETDDLPGEAEL